MKPAASRLFSMLVGLCCGAALAVFTEASEASEAGAAEAPPDAVQGQKLSAGVCVACHANNGSRGLPLYPILQGQHPEYIVKQLTEFKSGVRMNPVMMAYASALTADDMRNVAAFYAGKQAEPGLARSKELAIAGEKIYRGGIADRGVPACAGCHGPAGAGIPAQYPRLAGQHADYTAAQLTAFRGGGRKNGPQMMAIAARLGDQDIKALAEYTAGLR